jgi:hypothetical protein
MTDRLGKRPGPRRLALAAALAAGLVPSARPCTIAVVSGLRTADGRPLLWKNRDVTEQDNVVRFYQGRVHAYLGLSDAGVTDKIFAGLNSAGLAIVNAVSGDLDGSSDSENGVFIKRILEECATIEDVDALLAATNASGRKTQANFGLIDARGQGAIFETGNRSYARFDASAAPAGFLVRTNFAVTGTKPEQGEGFIRFDRATVILGPAAAARSIDVRFLFDRGARDLVNEDVDPYPLPFRGTQNGHAVGYIHTNYSINRYRTASAVVFRGVGAGEDPLLATMWALLGEPVCGIALPLWVRAGAVPYEVCGTYTSPLRDAVMAKEVRCYDDASSDRYLNTRALGGGSGRGLAALVGRIESFVFPAAEISLAKWRRSPPIAAEVRNVQNSLAGWSYLRYVAGAVGF